MTINYRDLLVSSLPFSMPLRVYIEDTDAGGVVYHSKYLNYMERTRTSWLEQITGAFDILEKKNLIFVVTSAKVNFYKPARLRNYLSAKIENIEIKNASILLKQSIFIKENKPENIESEILSSQADISIALVDQYTFKLKRIPL